MRNRPSHNRRAFTLIELLVVIAIISLLVGLLLAAIQMVRQSAAKAGCQNQIHQISVALHHYHDANNHFPPGHRSLFNLDLMPYSGWPLSILPYVEQPSLYDASVAEFHVHIYPLGNNPHSNLSTVVPAFLCPSDWCNSATPKYHSAHIRWRRSPAISGSLVRT